jgi:sugar phosphate isomerase/epimerase
MSAENEGDTQLMTTRRNVLQLLAAGVAGGTLLPSILSASGSRRLLADDTARRINRIGLQLYTVRTALAKDIEGTIAAIAAAGITELEFADYFRKDPAWWSALLKTHGLTAPSAHMALPATDAEWGPMFDTANAMGHKLVIMPFLRPDQRKTSDDWKQVAARLNIAATKAKAAGLEFGYHNHDFEFAPIDGTTGYEIITSQTDKSLVKLEMDLYWTIKAGQDPLALMGKMPGRVVAVHVKDMGPPPERAWADVGSGSIDFKTILTKARTMGVKYWFIEHDMPKDPLASIKASAAAMKGF